MIPFAYKFSIIAFFRYLPLILPPIVVLFRGEEAGGELAFYIYIGAILGLIFSLNLSNSIVFFGSTDIKFIDTLTAFSLAISIIIFLVACFASWFLGFDLILFLIFGLSDAVFRIFFSRWRVGEVYFRLFEMSSLRFMSIIAAFFFDDIAEAFGYAQLFLVFWLTFRSGFNFLKLRQLYFLSDLKDQIYFSVRLFLYSFSQNVMSYSDRIIVGSLMGNEALGVYSIVYFFGSIPSILNLYGNTLYPPKFFRMKDVLCRVETIKVSSLTGFSYLVFYLVLTVIVEYIFEIFALPVVDGLMFQISLIFVAYYFLHLQNMVSLYIQKSRLEYLSSLSAIFATLFNVPITFLLVDNYGFVGAAMSTMFTSVNFFISSTYLFQKKRFLTS